MTKNRGADWLSFPLFSNRKPPPPTDEPPARPPFPLAAAHPQQWGAFRSSRTPLGWIKMKVAVAGVSITESEKESERAEGGRGGGAKEKTNTRGSLNYG